MRHYHYVVIIVLKYVCCVNTADSQATSGNRELYSELCMSSPSSLIDRVSFPTMMETQPTGGFICEFGDESVLNGGAQMLGGNKVADHSKFCFRSKFEQLNFNNTGGTGKLLGYGEVLANWNCNPSERIKGMLTCLVKSGASPKDTRIVDLFFSYADKTTSLYSVVLCYDDGTVGWHSLATYNPLTDEDRNTLEVHIQEFGFPENSALLLHDFYCPKSL